MLTLVAYKWTRTVWSGVNHIAHVAWEDVSWQRFQVEVGRSGLVLEINRGSCSGNGKDIILYIVMEKPDAPGQTSFIQIMWKTSVEVNVLACPFFLPTLCPLCSQHSHWQGTTSGMAGVSANNTQLHCSFVSLCAPVTALIRVSQKVTTFAYCSEKACCLLIDCISLVGCLKVKRSTGVKHTECAQ